MIRLYEPLILTSLLWFQQSHVDWTIHGDTGKYLDSLSKSIAHVRLAAQDSGLVVIVERMDKISQYINRGADIHTIITIAQDSIGDIQRELMRHLYLRVPYEDRTYYDALPMSQKAADAFPSAVRDVQAAGRCFALDEWTACVLHAMRALEFPIVAMVKALHFTPSNANWEIILNECEREIRQIGQNNPSQTWKEDEKFFSEAALSFRYFKNAWRNHAMHGRDTYDRREAREILSHATGLMDHLAVKLSE